MYRRTVQTTLKASYSNHYRRGLIEQLESAPSPPDGSTANRLHSKERAGKSPTRSSPVGQPQ